MKNNKLLLGAAGLMAIAGMLFLFTMGSLIPGLLLIVTALMFTVYCLNDRKPSENGGKTDVIENVADLNDRFNRARYQDKDGQ